LRLRSSSNDSYDVSDNLIRVSVTTSYQVTQSSSSPSTLFSDDSYSAHSDNDVPILHSPNPSDEEYFSHRRFLLEGDKTVAVKDPLSPQQMTSTDICPLRFIDAQPQTLVEFSKNEIIPSYAILSHRWMKGEVVYKEFIEPKPETFKKHGFMKIRRACRQARDDGIRYLWADTCCIKQGDHADVAANITSMYAYYQNAQVCYAYLVDVISRDNMFGKLRKGSNPGGSEWLDRGWTLQELVAPRTVIFFNWDWQRIGDKHELRDDIHRGTSIPLAVLSCEQSVKDVNVMDRMSWSMWRKTTKEQDQAYCLQGLLGVTIEPDYEELPETSFNRLGRALIDAQPEVKERLGIDEVLLNDPENGYFYVLLRKRFWGNWDRILNVR